MKRVLITGCSSGIGLAAARAFTEAGDVVHAAARSRSSAGALEEAAEGHANLHIHELDVAQSGGFHDFIAAIVGESGGIDVLVNNAGILPVGAFEDFGESGLRLAMETNFFGAALLTQAVLPHMRAQKSGYIIMISSLSGIAAKAGDSAYSASKFALEGLTEALRHEVARWNIKTALVEPAQYATSMFRATEAGELGYCAEGSPYYPLIKSQQDELRGQLSGGRDASLLGDLLVEISRSDGRRFRWPADNVAQRVTTTMWAQDDAERDRFLRNVAAVDWWVEGRDRPDKDGGQ